jgi:hypothetical protein
MGELEIYYVVSWGWPLCVLILCLLLFSVGECKRLLG